MGIGNRGLFPVVLRALYGLCISTILTFLHEVTRKVIGVDIRFDVLLADR